MIEDYEHTLLEQEEQHFYSCVADVISAFQCHGAGHILHEVSKNPQLNQELNLLFSHNTNG